MLRSYLSKQRCAAYLALYITSSWLDKGRVEVYCKSEQPTRIIRSNTTGNIYVLMAQRDCNLIGKTYTNTKLDSIATRPVQKTKKNIIEQNITYPSMSA